MTDEKPALKAVPSDAEPKKLRGEDELRKAINALMVRRQVAATALQRLYIQREDWQAVGNAAADLREIEAHIEALQFALGERPTIN